VSTDLRRQGEHLLMAEASFVSEGALKRLASLVEVELEELLSSRGFPLAVAGTRQRYFSRRDLLAWWRATWTTRERSQAAPGRAVPATRDAAEAP